MRLARVSAGLVACGMAVLPSSAAAATVAQTGGVGTAVREYGGTIVFSEFDRVERRWYLSVREVGERQRRVGVAPSPVSFDADIGTDSRGRPQLIYRRCSGTVSAPKGCDLFVFSLATSTGERAVRNANDQSRNDVSPTLWRGRIAWTREYGSGKDANPVVYKKTLTAPRSQPSTRLPGVPERRCASDVGLVDPPCGPTTSRRVDALELWGDNLGLIVGYVFEGLPGTSQAEVRLDRVSERSARQVAFLTSGLNAQFLAGPSLGGGRLAWYRACAVTEAACRTFVGPWRYRISTRGYQRGAPGPIQVRGFADTGTRLYEVVCPAGETIVDFQPPLPGAPDDCPIESVAPPAYTTVPQPDLAPSKPPTG